MDTEDFQIRSALQKLKTKKLVKTQSVTDELLNKEPKKISTKTMVHQALSELVTNRKGTSLYAIKKYIETNFNVDTNSSFTSRLIKKCIKNGVEDGTILQIKGIGASGSFRLAAKKNVNKKKTEKKAKEEEKVKSSSKEVEKKEKKSKTIEDGKKVMKKVEVVIKKSKKDDGKVKSVEIDDKKLKKLKKIQKPEKKVKGEKNVKGEKKKENSEKKSDTKREKEKKAVGMFTPAKKRAILKKRKSIGSIIKPPKMKPR